jgi:GrpB-like predicted nucleotidyltransferase (UPF0157 family)
MPDASIHVVPYDPIWPTHFEREKAYLESLLAPWKSGPIEHVGSTAVPGLCAKPVIDVMVGVRSLVESEPAKDVLSANGYQYSDYRSDVSHWFCKPSFEFRTHHLHLVPYESSVWQARLRFRDILRSDSSVAADYAALKIELAKKFELDREAYTEGKTPFIARVLEHAGQCHR